MKNHGYRSTTRLKMTASFATSQWQARCSCLICRHLVSQRQLQPQPIPIVLARTDRILSVSCVHIAFLYALYCDYSNFTPAILINYPACHISKFLQYSRKEEKGNKGIILLFITVLGIREVTQDRIKLSYHSSFILSIHSQSQVATGTLLQL